jgi:enoyl-CoA hydratase
MALIIENENNIYTITINRPEALNAINRDVMQGLDAFFTTHQKNYNVRGVIIKGAGEKAFAAGADIKEFSSMNATEGSLLSKYGQDVYFKIEKFHAPVIAVVQGFCLGGGCELAMACHMRIAGPKAKFGQPEINLGIVPGYGATQRLTFYIGKSKAIELLLTADMIGAEEAYELGLVNHVTEAGEELNKALEILYKISEKAPIATQYIIQCVNEAHDETANGFETEYNAFGKCIESEDGREGATAFVEKRKAIFKGK